MNVFRHFRFLAGFLLALAMVTAVTAAGTMFWYYHRPLPDALTNQPLFPGITYTRVIHTGAVPQVFHVVTVDLTTPGLHFLTTPPDNVGTYTYAAKTVSEFLQQYHVQLAINADYFEPWWYNSLTDYYPHEGDGVNPNGYAVSSGHIVSYGVNERFHTMFITADNHVSFDVPPAAVDMAVSGNVMLVTGGVYSLQAEGEFITERHPRTGIGLDESGTHLLLFLVDGRQPNYSEGATIPEFGELMVQNGVYTGMNLDGGGSTSLVIEDANGQPELLNSPIHARIPGLQRPIASHLGIIVDEKS